jgi:hypothetical protein
MRIALGTIGALVVAFVAITWFALESGGVAIVETRAAGGSIRSTHVWFVEPEGELWLEAGSRQNSWFEDLGRDSRLSLLAEGRAGSYIATHLDDPEIRARIRALLREKYGLRDRWVGLFVDPSQALVVRLDPAPP